MRVPPTPDSGSPALRARLLAVAMLLSPLVAGARPSFTGIAPVPNSPSQGLRVSGDGSTVIGVEDSRGVFHWSRPTGARFIGMYWVRGLSDDGSSVVLTAGGSDTSRWTLDGGLTTLRRGGAEISPYAMSGDGSAIVGSTGGYYSDAQPFRWTAVTGVQPLGHVPGHPVAEALAVSDDGRVIGGLGTTYDSFDRFRQISSEAFRWTADTGIVPLGKLSPTDRFSRVTAVSGDGSTLVGVSGGEYFGSGGRAFRWTERDGMRAISDRSAYPRLISHDGSVVVGTFRSNKPLYRWTEATGITDLGVLDPDGPKGGWMFPNGMSADGSVIVGGARTSEGYKAFIWDPQHGLRALQDVLTGGLGLDLSGWSLMMANGISDDGTTVTGTGIRNGRLEAWVAVIPEPRAAVVLAGLFLFGSRRPRTPVRHRTRTPPRMLPCVLATIMLLLPIAVLGQPSFTALEVPGARYVNPTAVSGDGSAVIGKVEFDGDSSPRAFHWSRPAGFTILGFAEPRGVSDDGSVVIGMSEDGERGYRWSAGEGLRTVSDALQPAAISGDGGTVVGTWIAGDAFRWTAARGFQSLGPSPGFRYNASYATIVSDDGRAVGGGGFWIISDDRGEARSPDETEAFRWTPETGRVPLGWLSPADLASFPTAISDDGSVLVGTSGPPSGEHRRRGFRWTESGGMRPLTDRVGAVPLMLSSDGSVVAGVYYTRIPETNEFLRQLFRWTEHEGFVELGLLDPGADQKFTHPTGMSADGAIIVGAAGLGPGSAPFIWDAAHGLRPLQEVLSGEYGLDLSGWRLTSAHGLSEDGRTIIGGGLHNGIDRKWVAVIPEPATLGPVLAGGALGAFCRRRAGGVARTTASVRM